MLAALFGNKNIQKILIFLFVNEKCYGTQLQRLLTTPLTPIQKALLRLEKGGILTSFYEGKTRLYQFNPSYPLLPELEQLLKKTYTLLTPQEKRLYSFVKEDNSFQNTIQGTNDEILMAFWERLACVQQLTFQAKTKSKESRGWNGKGKGEVIVTRESDAVLIFHEKGLWKGLQGEETNFNNIYRWTFDKDKGLISLEHLRLGLNRPVFLFNLAPSGIQGLKSIDAHLCDGDTYFGQIYFNFHSLRFNWRIIGPHKNEEIEYYYT